LHEGYSDYLFIPTLFDLFRVNQIRTGLNTIWFMDIKPGINLPQLRSENDMSTAHFQKIKGVYGVPRFYEATHAEILLTKKVMDA
jgi:hypothetical protein